MVALLTMAGCAARQPTSSDLPSEPFAGHLTWSDGYWFERCGSTGERWWVTFVDRASGQMQQGAEVDALKGGGRRFVRVSAARTDERHVGPGGPALLVRDIVEIRNPSDTDCGRPSNNSGTER